MLQCAILHHPPTREVIFLVVFHASHKKQQKINKKQQETKVYSGFCLYSWGVLPVYRRKAL